MAAPVKKLMGP